MKHFKSGFLKLLILSISILLCQSCFEIVEEVNLNDDGSGTFCFTINMSQSKLNINSLFLLDSINHRPMPKKEDLNNTIDKVDKALKEDLNIGNVVTKKNWEEYIFSVSGSFTNIDALNMAINKINTLFNQHGRYESLTHNNFSYADKIFTRLYNYNLVNEYNSMAEKDKTVFNNAKYTTIYRFARQVANYSNPEATKSKSGKAIMLKVDVKDLITNNKTIKNSINFN